MINVALTHDYCVIEPQGPLTKEDFAAIASHIDPILEAEGHLDGLIIKTREFPGWEGIGDVIEHFRFVKNHHRSIRKIAFVTDAKVAGVFPAIVSHFVKAEVKLFDFDDFAQAVDWIN